MNAPHIGSFLRGILDSVEEEIAAARRNTPEADLQRRIADTPPVRSFRDALSGDFGLIAEVKKRSPSLGEMRAENYERAVAAYHESSIVRALSVLTNHSHFGMNIENLWRIKQQTGKPILRKEFIVSEYQVLEARAWGADAILLMANILSAEQLLQLGTLAKSLGLGVLYESHTRTEIDRIPRDIAECWGINCRKLDSKNPFRHYKLSQLWSKLTGGIKDFSIEDKPLELIGELPREAVVKVAESGITPVKIAAVRDRGFNAALVGNCLLLAPDGVDGMLQRFAEALCV